MGYYNYPEKIARYFGFSRRDWLHLTKSEKCRYVRKYDYEVEPEKMQRAAKKKGVTQRQLRAILMEVIDNGL